MKNQLRILSFGMLIAAFPVAGLANSIPVVTEVNAAQRGDGSGIVDVHFRLYDADGDPMTVRLFLSADGGQTYPFECLSISPAPGSSFGSGQWYLTWEALADYPGHQGSYRVRVQADDGQSVPPGAFVQIPAGSFLMGAPADELGSESDERPQHTVTLTHSFYLQSTEVTNQQYLEMAQWAYDHGYVTATTTSLRDALDGSTEELLELDGGSCEIAFINGIFSLRNAGHGINPDHPVKEVTWYGSAAYCDWLSMAAEPPLPRAYNHSTWQCNGNSPYTAVGYRLPTEAEWEYACRAGSSTAFANGPISYTDCTLDPVLNQIGWYCGNAGGWTHPVGQKIPNVWGLYDLHGNAWEWCNDWYLSSYDGSSPSSNPVGPISGSLRVLRSGHRYIGARFCRSADRYRYGPGISSNYAGFRPARSAD